VVAAGACGLTVLVRLTAGRPKGSRIIAALGVAAVIWGWGVAQYPALLPGTAVTLTSAGTTQATFAALVVVAIVAVVLVVPSFARPAVHLAGPPPAWRG
jgi:cytochrome d ubiquinol oxidase subunit II